MFVLDLPQVKEAERKGCVFGFVSLTGEDFEVMKKAHAEHSPFIVEKMVTREHYIAFAESFRFIRRRNIQNNAVRYVCFVGVRVTERYSGRTHIFDGFFALHEKDDYLS